MEVEYFKSPEQLEEDGISNIEDLIDINSYHNTDEKYENTTITDPTILQSIVEFMDESTKRSVVRSFIMKHGLVRHQKESFEKFMEVYIPQIIHENSTLVVDSDVMKRRQVIEFKQHVVYKPSSKESSGFNRDVLPYECRMRGLTYACSVMVDVSHTIYDISAMTPDTQEKDLPICGEKLYREALLCQIPIMLKTKYCHLFESPYLANEDPYDQGGYFIINGSEKVVIAQERMKTNYPYVFPVKQPSKYSYVCEVRSCHEQKMRSTSTLYCYLTNTKNGNIPEIYVMVPFIAFAIPLIVIFRLLDVFSIYDMEELILSNSYIDKYYENQQYGDYVMNNLVKALVENDMYDQMDFVDLCEWVGKNGTKETTKEKRVRYVEHIMANEFLPHIGLDRSEETLKKKTIFFCDMIYKLCRVFLERQNPDDRDHYENKRADCTGNLLGLLFRPLWRTLLKNMSMYIRRNMDSGKVINISDAINAKRITSGIKYAMSTGNWGVQKGGSSTTGVAQVHTKMTSTAAFSNLRRLNTHINKEGKMPKPRQLHISHWGIICPIETPEGANCGLVKNLALSCHIRVGFPPDLIINIILSEMPIVKPILRCTIEERKKFICVLVNGITVGYTTDAKFVLYYLRQRRRYQSIPFDTSIVYIPSNRKIRIQTDTGCFCRPLFVVENLDKFERIFKYVGNEPSVLWDELLCHGLVEYVDKEEEKTLRVAVLPEDLLSDDSINSDEPYTHLEIHTSLLFSVCSSLIPLLNHNHAPRSIYQSAMGKQSMSLQGFNLEKRVDTVSHELWYPQVPLVQTMMEDIIDATKLPSGQNILLAITTYTGFNQEDSIIMNQSSIERGLFRSTIKRTYKDEEKTRGTDSSKFEKPPMKGCRGLRKANYDKLTKHGFVEPGTVINPNDVIIGKTMNTEEIMDYGMNDSQQRTSTKGIKRDNSSILKTNEPAVVHKVVDTINKEGCKSLKVTTRAMRIPEIGDKFSSRHGQKGTVGMVYRHEDMPFTMDGRTPDAIINPHALPSRMTVGMLIEELLGKAAAIDGEIGDGTPFNELTIDEISKVLIENGFQGKGKELMINGMTGEPMESLIFFAPCFYQRLRHVAIDKIHARARGPVQILTHQPVEGRARDGGFRLGEMERDCIISHGAAQFLKERLFEQSDAYMTVICEKCGMLSEPEKPKNASIIGMHIRGSKAYCRNCDSYDSVKEIRIPYACKLLIQELMAMNIVTRLRLSEAIPVEGTEQSAIQVGKEN